MLYFWFRAFVFTQIVEAPIYRRLLGTSWTRSLLPTTITHPFVWFVFPWIGLMGGLGWTTTMILAELFAWLVEAFFLARTRPRISLRRALLASFVANGASVLLGLTCRALFGAP